MAEILLNEFFDKVEVSEIDVKSKQGQCIEQMKEVNNLNTQYFLKANKIKKGEHKMEPDKPLADVESMWLKIDFDQIKHHSAASKFLFLPSINLKVNLYTSIVENKHGDMKVVRKTISNNRRDRLRPESSQKSDGSSLVISAPGKQDFAK